MLAEYGLRSHQVDSMTTYELTLSYMKRKQFEAQQMALQVGKLFGGVSEQVNTATGRTVADNDPLGPGRTSGDAMMGSLGFKPDLGINKARG